MDTEEAAPAALSPDEAFALVADETRLEILRTLAESGEALAFSTLFERSDYETRSNFSYHLDRLEGHFITRTDDGYVLRQTGRRILEAVIAGTITENLVVEREPIDEACPFCSAPIEVSYQQERVEMFCTECPGFFRQADSGEAYASEFGTLGHIHLPPAGVPGRTPAEMHHAAIAWSNLELLGISTGICPRCSGSIEHAVAACDDHDADGVCGQCDRRYAILFKADCTACHYSTSGIPNICLLGRTELLSFITDHGANPLRPDSQDIDPGALANYEEAIHSHDPFEATISFTLRDETLTVTINEDVEIIGSKREHASGTE